MHQNWIYILKNRYQNCILLYMETNKYISTMYLYLKESFDNPQKVCNEQQNKMRLFRVHDYVNKKYLIKQFTSLKLLQSKIIRWSSKSIMDSIGSAKNVKAQIKRRSMHMIYLQLEYLQNNMFKNGTYNFSIFFY